MAIFHMQVSVASRTGGQSARAKFRYIAKEGRYGRDGKKAEVQLLESGNMPAWARKGRDYWVAADRHERGNGALCRSMIVALPAELTRDQNIALAREFCAQLTGGRLPYTVAVHWKPGDTNPHMHVLISERALDGHNRTAEVWFKRADKRRPERGGAAKDRTLQSREWLRNARKLLEASANTALAEAGRLIAHSPPPAGRRAEAR